MIYMLDTNICIYIINRSKPGAAARLLALPPTDVRLPAVVKAELIYGAEKSPRRSENIVIVQKFLAPFQIAPFSSDAASHYGAVRAGLEKRREAIGPNDLLIAATALAFDAVLVTNNMREFARVPNLRLENWVD
jgi:tRNA(fMet)-specific endonuclease VapC